MEYRGEPDFQDLVTQGGQRSMRSMWAEALPEIQRTENSELRVTLLVTVGRKEPTQNDLHLIYSVAIDHNKKTQHDSFQVWYPTKRIPWWGENSKLAYSCLCFSIFFSASYFNCVWASSTFLTPGPELSKLGLHRFTFKEQVKEGQSHILKDQWYVSLDMCLWQYYFAKKMESFSDLAKAVSSFSAQSFPKHKVASQKEAVSYLSFVNVE